MSKNEDSGEDSNGENSFQQVKQRFKDRSKKVAQTKDLLSKQAVQTKEILSKQAVKIAKQAEEHESFISKVTHLMGVLWFGGFCFLLGARPQDIRYVYCLFYVIFVPLRWIYYRFKKWHYYLLDFCYYANTIFLVDLLLYPRNEKLFMICFSFAEGPLAWALIVWRCSLVFSSLDKLVSVLIHLLPGIVFFTIRWWDPATFAAMHPEGTSRRVSWPYIEDKSYLWKWLFVVPLFAYTLWQVLYFLIVNVLRRQRLLRDPEVMTSYRELSKKAQKANNIWWRLSGLLGDQNRMFMYILLQGLFTVATMALTVPIFLSYELHMVFQILKVSATAWNGGSFLLDVMPRQVILKEKKKSEMQPAQQEPSEIVPENSTETENVAES
ncbi:membrane protein [Parasponia andersonii]|uniref:Glycerophosphocholine acyltransferase 1 n=1 Tax=Parasponia andersonii TaxID=3476 RepID=A0A2P5AS85_PARAD|nr:membrane protein [Parasponia andersonii]